MCGSVGPPDVGSFLRRTDHGRLEREDPVRRSGRHVPCQHVSRAHEAGRPSIQVWELVYSLQFIPVALMCCDYRTEEKRRLKLEDASDL